MLVLSRKVGQKIVLGDEVVLVVNRIAGNRVSISIEAPPHVRIVRGELPVENSFAITADVNPLAENHLASEERMSPGSKAVGVACE
jgi:carbon storage regulator